MQNTRDPITLTGTTYVTGALADIFGSRELVQRRAAVGDIKLWCHIAHEGKKPVWSRGQFRAAVFDGREWRTFRLNIVADEDAFYDNLEERPRKARRIFDAIVLLKGQKAYWRDGASRRGMAKPKKPKGTYGVTFTLKADTAHSTAGATREAGATTGTHPVVPHEAARTTTTPVAAVAPRSTTMAPRRRRRRKGEAAPGQLSLF